jgi:S-formylglutathione hydrolase FrmB
VATGEKAFGGYLAGGVAAGKAHDAVELMGAVGPFEALGEILVDQGTADDFLAKGQLKPEDLKAACAAKGQPFTLNMREASSSARPPVRQSAS